MSETVIIHANPEAFVLLWVACNAAFLTGGMVLGIWWQREKSK